MADLTQPVFEYKFTILNGTTEIDIPHQVNAAVINAETRQSKVLHLGTFIKFLYFILIHCTVLLCIGQTQGVG